MVRPFGDPTRPAIAPVVMLRPIRTITIARDLAFRQRAMTVLAELGPTAFAVMAPAPEEVAALVLQQGADVVVLDLTASGPALPNILAALFEHASDVGVVAVSDSADPAAQGLHVLPKWGWAAELTHAVQEAQRRGNPLDEESPGVCQQRF